MFPHHNLVVLTVISGDTVPDYLKNRYVLIKSTCTTKMEKCTGIIYRMPTFTVLKLDYIECLVSPTTIT